MLGQYSEALIHYDVAIKKKSTDAVFFYNRGLTYASLERFEEAKKDFLRALDGSQNV
jgi:tetratricopeptide (TPR) repeat protein